MQNLPLQYDDYPLEKYLIGEIYNTQPSETLTLESCQFMEKIQQNSMLRSVKTN